MNERHRILIIHTTHANCVDLCALSLRSCLKLCSSVSVWRSLVSYLCVCVCRFLLGYFLVVVHLLSRALVLGAADSRPTLALTQTVTNAKFRFIRVFIVRRVCVYMLRLYCANISKLVVSAVLGCMRIR